MELVKAVHQLTQGQVLAIDGKTSRGSLDSANGKTANHLLNAWASANTKRLAQTKVNQKSNEITANPEHRVNLTREDKANVDATLNGIGTF